MKPNYKESAEKYERLYYDSQERLSFLHKSIRDMTADLTRQNEEINEWKRKYSELLDKLIALQEKVAEAKIDKVAKDMTESGNE